ncbi:MAG: hypothetical protein WC832_13675 [Anaerolineales bacterium]
MTKPRARTGTTTQSIVTRKVTAHPYEGSLVLTLCVGTLSPALRARPWDAVRPDGGDDAPCKNRDYHAEHRHQEFYLRSMIINYSISVFSSR